MLRSYNQATVLFLALLSILALGLSSTASAQQQPDQASVQLSWRLLDYIAVDYREAVSDGRVINAGEYEEMVEFADSVFTRFQQLPESAAKSELLAGTESLKRAISQKVDPDELAVQARSLANDLLRAYPVPLTPEEAPDMTLAADLYSRNCASCHGTQGGGDGAASRGLDPPPIAFSDRERADERSVFALYQVIEQGIEGTSMASYSHLPPEERWALAFYVGSLAYSQEEASQGRSLWDKSRELRNRFDLKTLVTVTPGGLAEQYDGDKGAQLTAFLRRHPQSVETSPNSLELARQKLDQSLAAYSEGERETAGALALSAYLDGFEPMEPLLRTRDGELLGRVEKAMAELRSGISEGLPPQEVTKRGEHVKKVLREVETVLSDDGDSALSSFLGTLTILLREGVEALLIVVGMVTFLRKAERAEAVKYVHGGWIGALLAGVVTWFVATRMIAVSGATRELTEGLASTLAALILLWVGVWMHGKSHAEAWQEYIKEKMNRSLSRGSAWFLFGLSFLVVYREVFETILFCAAIWNQGHTGAMTAGILVALAGLGAIAWSMFRWGKKLPIGKFFSYSSMLLGAIAVILTGKGISALQEAGLVPLTFLDQFPRLELLGIYPTLEGLAGQTLMVFLLAIGFNYTRVNK